MKITVNLVDDHKIVTEGLSLILSNEDDIEIWDVAQSGPVALAQLNLRTPDIVLLDYSLKNNGGGEEMDGHSTARSILAKYPHVRIMMLTMHDESNIILSCVTLGVHGYMLKSEKSTNIAAALRQLYIQGHYFSPDVAKYLATNLRKQTEESIELSQREQEVLEALYVGSSTKEIAEDLFISRHTVESHRKNLIQKFHAKNSIHLIYLALKKGYLKV